MNRRNWLWIGTLLALLSLLGCGGEDSPGRRRKSPPPSGLEIGQPLPDVVLGQPAGGTMSLRTLAAGKVLLVDVWATWCGPCKFAAPHIQALHNKFRDREFTAVGVMVDDDATAIAAEVLEKERPVYPQLLDDGGARLGDAWGTSGSIPIFVLAGRDGKVLRIDTGIGDLPGLQAAVEAAVRGQEQPQASTEGTR